MSEQTQPSYSQTDAAQTEHQAASVAENNSIHYSAIKRLFLFLSKTDLHALQFATPITEMTQASIGTMVATTGILAFCSSFFTVETAFFKGDHSPLSIIIPLLVASVYATAIITFDREIVGVTEKKPWPSIMRIAFAIILGIVIAFPIELKIMEGKIDEQISIETDKTHQGLISEQEHLKQHIRDEQESIINTSQNDVEQEQNKVRILSEQFESEGKNVRCLALCKEREAKLAAAQENLRQAQANLAKTRADMSGRFKAETARIAEIDKIYTRDWNNNHDLLSQGMALSVITSQNDTARHMSYFLTVFFILFELFPVLVKLAQPYNEYHAYLDARMEMTKAKIFIYANGKLADWDIHPEHIHLDGTEETDVLEQLMEDRNKDVRRN